MKGTVFVTRGIKRDMRTMLFDHPAHAAAMMCISLLPCVFLMSLCLLLYRLCDIGIVSHGDTFVSAIAAISNLIFLSPLRLGEAKWYLALSRGKALPISSILHYYRSPKLFFIAIAFETGLLLRYAIFGFLCFTPAAMCAVWASVSSEIAFRWRINAACLGLFVGGLLLFFILSARYFAAVYLLADGCRLQECFRKSSELLRGSEGRILGLTLSFSGWAAASFLLIPAAAALSYFKISLAGCVRKLIDDA